MDLALSRDIEQILLDTERAKGGLERLKRDHAAWERGCAEEDLAWLANLAVRLEIDLSLFLSDCMPLGQRSRGEANQDVSQDLRQGFVTLNALLTKLKKAREELGRAYIHPDTLKHLEILWDRFAKKIGKAQEHLRAEDDRLDVSDTRLTASLMAAMVKD